MKTVWIVNHYAQEPSGPGGTRHWSLAEHLRAHGWGSVIIAASIELNTGRDRLAPKENRRVETFGATPFVWLRVPPHEGNGCGRVINMLIFATRAARVRPDPLIDAPDVVVGSSVHPFAALAGWMLARQNGVPFVFEVRDLWPQTLIDLGRISPRGIAARILGMLERFLYRRASCVISLLPRASEYIAAKGAPPERVVWIPNGVEPGPTPAAARSGNPGECTFMYFGAHGEANGLENVLHAMAFVKADASCAGIRLRLVGDGPSKPALRQLASTLDLDNVRFEPPVPKSAVPRLASEADAFVFNLVDAPVFRFGVSSNKLFDFLAAGRPIVFCCDAGNNPVREAGAGVTVLPGDPRALYEAMRAVAGMDSAGRRSLGDAGRSWVVRNHAYEELAGRLARVLNSVAGEPR